MLALIMILAALSTVFLGRLLSEEDFGEFALMRTLVLFIAPLTVWGQDVATARFFAQHDARHYKWTGALKTILGIGAVLMLMAVAIAAFVYSIALPKVLLLIVASFAYMCTLFFSNLVRGQGHYRQAILMLNGFRGLFFLLVLALYLSKAATATLTILSYYAIIIFLAIVNARYAFIKVKQGTQPVPKEMHQAGLLLMGSQASVTLIGSLDSLFIPGLLDLASLAVYQAAVVPSQIFNIIGRAGKYVWVPEFGRSGTTHLKKISLLVAVTALALLTIMLVFAEPILHALFAGKYDSGANVLRLLAVAGTIRLFYNLGSSVIVGKLQNDALVYHLVLNIILVFVEIALLILLLNSYGVLGAAVTMLCVTILRTCASYGIIYKFKHQLNQTV
ncbi:oligosaccharide flippase family protein [candidate division KSB1 bacterium]|nr:oligosaccharide flippase family protein [candidate division KSB1 bacterium]